MVFKKNDEATRLAAIKGGKTKNKLHPKKTKIIKTENKYGNCGKHLKNFNSDKNHQSCCGKKSRTGENLKAEELKSQYDNIFLPQSICDRICIKDGKIIFVEIKKKGQKLREKQQEFKELCDKFCHKYIIEYI